MTRLVCRDANDLLATLLPLHFNAFFASSPYNVTWFLCMRRFSWAPIHGQLIPLPLLSMLETIHFFHSSVRCVSWAYFRRPSRVAWRWGESTCRCSPSPPSEAQDAVNISLDQVNALKLIEAEGKFTTSPVQSILIVCEARRHNRSILWTVSRRIVIIFLMTKAAWEKTTHWDSPSPSPSLTWRRSEES